jgi:hypothetical protein
MIDGGPKRVRLTLDAQLNQLVSMLCRERSDALVLLLAAGSVALA